MLDISRFAGRPTADNFRKQGHDSVYTNLVCPTAMVFTPCRDGISHNPAEYASPEDCSIGAQTILGAVLKYDGLLKEKYSN